MCYYDDNKEVNLKIFKLKCAHIRNVIDENLFEEVFGHTFVTLADKLINTTNKEENIIIFNDIKKNKDKLYEQDDFNNFVIQPGHKRVDLIDAAKIILEFNETIQSDLVWKQKHKKHKMNAYCVKKYWSKMFRTKNNRLHYDD